MNGILSWQDIINALQLYVLAPFFINIVMYFIEDNSNSLSFFLSSSSDEKANNILSIIKKI